MSSVVGGAQVGRGAVKPSAKPPNNELKVVVGTTAWKGWQGVAFTSGIERFPATLALSGSEYNPFSPGRFNIPPGSRFQAYVGDDLIVTGWMETYGVELEPKGHNVSISGRSLACDLLDCQADLTGNSIQNVTLLALAQKLAAPYNVPVRSLDGPGPVLPFLNFFVTQTPYDIITQAARYCQFLVYDAPDGALILARAQKGAGRTMASGFKTGVNIEACNVVYDITQRYSEYRVYIQSTDFLLNGGATPANEDPNLLAVAKDAPGAIRHRIFASVAETGQNYQQLAMQQAQWELNRRRGRSQQVRLTTDSWRDSALKLWTPNYLAAVDIPEAKLTGAHWLITEVTFRLDQNGTHADLVLMPPESFEVQPSNLYLFDPNVQKALAKETGGAQTGGRTVGDGRSLPH